MINVMHSVMKPINLGEESLDPQLWHACAGGMAQLPPPNSKVYYFPQGHSEHVNGGLDLRGFSRIPPLILCRVSSVKYLADAESDEVYAKIRLTPLMREKELDDDDEGGFLGFDKIHEDKTNSFAKTLTQSDANNGGGFSVPRYCAETIFPRLDYSAEPPVQTILAKDVHGEIWKFRHIYRGTPRRHLLTTGWSNFVSQKKLVAGDSIVFLRAENGDLCVGIRRAKRGGVCGGGEVSCGWNTGGGFTGFLGESVNLCGVGLKEKGNVRGESVIEAANLAARGQPFEVVYYPRSGSPEFVVREAAVRAAMRVQWCPGMRFKMAFETEDSSRISWFMGTVSAVQANDRIHWPNSPWRLLQVAWDEPDLLRNVKRVNPWLVELVSTSHLSTFSPPRKRPRLPQPPEFASFGSIPVVSLPLSSHPHNPSSPLCCLPDNLCIQGARQPQYDLKKVLQPFDFKLLDYFESDSLPRSLKAGRSDEECKTAKTPMFVLFGQPILTEEQISSSHSFDSASDGNRSAVIQNFPPEGSSDEEFPRHKDQGPDLASETGHCKVFVESEDIGRTLDLAVLVSFEEVFRRLATMFGMERSEISSNVVYSDARGKTKHIGDEQFSDFIKNARKLTILTDSGSGIN